MKRAWITCEVEAWSGWIVRASRVGVLTLLLVMLGQRDESVVAENKADILPANAPAKLNEKQAKKFTVQIKKHVISV